jgi:hypothetical protein
MARRAILKRAFSQAAKIAKAALTVSKDAYEKHDVSEVLKKFSDAHNHMSKVLGKVVSKVKGPKKVKEAMKAAIRKKYIVVNPKKNTSIEALSSKDLNKVKHSIKKKFAMLVPDKKGGNMVPKFFNKPKATLAAKTVKVKTEKKKLQL